MKIENLKKKILNTFLEYIGSPDTSKYYLNKTNKYLISL